MAKEDRLTSKRIKLAVIVGVPLLLAVACSSNELTCAEGNKSHACRISGEGSDGLVTGSIQPKPENYQGTTVLPPSKMAAPSTVRSRPSLQKSHSAAARRQIRSRRTIRDAKYRRASSCEVTGSISHSSGYPSAAVRPPMGQGQRRQFRLATVHIVAPGETLYSIARRYDASVAEIASFNIIEDVGQINSGHTIIIPPS